MDDLALLKEQLTAAREQVRAYFEVPDCDWQGRYHDDRGVCRDCADGVVCEWLFAQDPDPDLSAFSPGQLREALAFAVGYLEGRMIEAGHEPERCGCGVCGWVRSVRANVGFE